MDDNSVVDVVDRDDFQHPARAVGADVENPVDLVDVRLDWPAATALSIACWMSGSTTHGGERYP